MYFHVIIVKYYGSNNRVALSYAFYWNAVRHNLNLDFKYLDISFLNNQTNKLFFGWV